MGHEGKVQGSEPLPLLCIFVFSGVSTGPGVRSQAQFAISWCASRQVSSALWASVSPYARYKSIWVTCGTCKNKASRSRAELWEAGQPPTLLPFPFLLVSPGQPQGNPLGYTPLLANGSGHSSELSSARRSGNGALGGPKAHRKLQSHPSLASQGSKKSKGSTKSAASQIPLQAQEGKYPTDP